MKLDGTQKQHLLNFIEENWEQFVQHMAGSLGITEEEADPISEELAETLTEEVQYG
ncbi:hypothetical protein [Aeromonas phage 32]|nr:hypothetical protein [Aeromonas phage 32]